MEDVNIVKSRLSKKVANRMIDVVREIVFCEDEHNKRILFESFSDQMIDLIDWGLSDD